MPNLYDRIAKHKNADVPFFLGGILLQIIVCAITNDTAISLICGVCGVISVVMCSQKKLSNYMFAFVQIITYMYLAWQERFYGELIENVFYFVTTAIGVILWSKHYDDSKLEVKVKQLTRKQFSIISVLTLVGISLLYSILYCTNDSQPFMDAISTIPAFVGQILLILRYKEQWYFWLTIDIASVIMWAVAGNYVMMVQFLFFSANCFYGLKKWSN